MIDPDDLTWKVFAARVEAESRHSPCLYFLNVGELPGEACQ